MSAGHGDHVFLIALIKSVVSRRASSDGVDVVMSSSDRAASSSGLTGRWGGLIECPWRLAISSELDYGD